MEDVLQALKDLATNEQRRIPYETLVNRVVELKRATGGKVSRNYKGQIRYVIDREIKCSRILLIVEGGIQTIEIDAAGRRFYARWKKSPSRPVVVPSRKQDVRTLGPPMHGSI
ncbi:hypothetical protein PYCCODRAFT_1472620 [Trametes coccinea BRFM310]|uniref:Uncharacterized protein n=1 Tax=Trametes coccinea (strain BRFM310) TaxID=1353009 RepID=A0A1Y2I5L8_TRAC3|nr:hypothetical protein PYCCODRAFT_1472620 [Trametes coccinea BRFM310]